MEGQRIGVFLLEGAFTLEEALGAARIVTIGGVECRALLPVLGPVRGNWPRSLTGPPTPHRDREEPGWPNSMNRLWGDPLPGGFIIRAIGVIPAGTPIPPGDEQVDFDHEVAKWRHLLRDWLAVAAEGPTDFPDRNYYGATIWGSAEYDAEDTPYQPPQYGHRRRPQLLSAKAWSHALEHASAGDTPPLARTLMTSALQAAGTANWRVAVIDAATAVEIALTAGLTARLSTEASARATSLLLASYRMLGKLIELSRKLDMPLSGRIMEDLVTPRNALAHKGKSATSSEAKAAISVAWEVVRKYDILSDCCQEPDPSLDALPSVDHT